MTITDSTSSGPIAETWVRPMTILKLCPTTWRMSAPIAASWGRSTIPVHTSSFGMIPKRHQANKWRLIVDLSSSKGGSVNDGVECSLCSFDYIAVTDIADVVLGLGRGALLAKSDIRHAYRQVPVHPDDRLLLGMWWQGLVFCDAALPFGLHSAPIIFSFHFSREPE